MTGTLMQSIDHTWSRPCSPGTGALINYCLPYLYLHKLIFSICTEALYNGRHTKIEKKTFQSQNSRLPEVAISILSPCLLRSSVCAEPEELHWSTWLQRCWAGLCLTTSPLGVISGASSCCGGVLLFHLHPWVALWRHRGVRKEGFLCIIADTCVWGSSLFQAHRIPKVVIGH